MRLSGTVYSETLGMDTGITIVTPNRIQSGEEYNVVYLLHGLCGNNKTWLDYSMLSMYAMGRKTIYILPEVARSFYTNMKYGLPYFSYLTEELPTICNSIFRICTDREHTAVMGGSMGGYGALKCALSKPEQYGMCAAFSSGCLFLKQGMKELKENGMNEEYIKNFGKQLVVDFQSIFGENYDFQPGDDLLSLIQLQKQKELPKLYLTCGTEDYFYRDHLAFCKELDSLKVDYTFEEWNARHDFLYFDEALKKAIRHFSL